MPRYFAIRFGRAAIIIALVVTFAFIVLRLSGTGTEGATLRLYLESYVAGPMGLNLDPQDALAPIIRAAHELAAIAHHTGRTAPNVVT